MKMTLTSTPATKETKTESSAPGVKQQAGARIKAQTLTEEALGALRKPVPWLNSTERGYPKIAALISECGWLPRRLPPEHLLGRVGPKANLKAAATKKIIDRYVHILSFLEDKATGQDVPVILHSVTTDAPYRPLSSDETVVEQITLTRLGLEGGLKEVAQKAAERLNGTGKGLVSARG